MVNETVVTLKFVRSREIMDESSSRNWLNPLGSAGRSLVSLYSYRRGK